MKKQSTNYRMTAFSCLCYPMFRFILPHSAVKGVSRQAHSPHKVTPCDALGLPFPIELPEPRPVDFDRLPPCILALCLSNLNALTLTLFELFTLQLRESCEHGEHKFSRRRVGVDVLLVADKRNALVGEGVDDAQQVLCGAP